MAEHGGLLYCPPIFPIPFPARTRTLILPKLRRAWLRRKVTPDTHEGVELLLHVGCGRERLEGWVNIDLQPLPGVDVVADVTTDLDFEDVSAVYAEHLLEHLELDGALRFLLLVHRALKEGAWLRLSTPNLDWVWSTHYRLEGSQEERRHMALRLNRAFHGWHHRFVWNEEFLHKALTACGFVDLRWCTYGQSEIELFKGIERHETYDDVPQLPHVLIVEGRKGPPQPEELRQLQDLVEREFLTHVRV